MSADKRFAYVFYATNKVYAVSAWIAARRLEQLGKRHDIDFLLLHLPLPGALISGLRDEGIITRRVKPLRFSYGRYFRDCLVKLRVFQCTEYDRVVFMDADTFPLRNMDHLFDLSFKEEIAAPAAYWLKQPLATSALFVTEPSLDKWVRIKTYFASAYENRHYDMDIINLAFRHSIHFLPDEYLCLNSDWEIASRCYFGDQDYILSKAGVVHFTALGKPWHYRPGDVRRLRPHAHPVFYDLWENWWQARANLIRDRGLPCYATRSFWSLLENRVKRLLR